MAENTKRSWLRMQADLIIVLVFTIGLSIFSLFIEMIGDLYRFFLAFSKMAVTRFIIVESFILLIGLLWIVYRRWRASYRKQIEFENVIESINPDVLLVIDSDRSIKYCNPRVESMFGWSPDEVMGKKTDFLYLDRRSLSENFHEIFRVLDAEGYHIGEARGVTKTGEIVPLEIITGVLSGSDGAVLLLRNIEDRKREERELQSYIEDRDRIEKELSSNITNFYNLARSVSAAILIVDESNIVRFVNPAAEVYFTKNEDELIGKPLQLAADGSIPVSITVHKQNIGYIGKITVANAEWSGKKAKLIIVVFDLDKKVL
jgi:PAS domain S-box-containing protein